MRLGGGGWGGRGEGDGGAFLGVRMRIRARLCKGPKLASTWTEAGTGIGIGGWTIKLRRVRTSVLCICKKGQRDCEQGRGYGWDLDRGEGRVGGGRYGYTRIYKLSSSVCSNISYLYDACSNLSCPFISWGELWLGDMLW